jgi:hypothetical protein
MDVTQHRVASSDKATLETPWQSAQWVSQLRLCAADESFFKRNRSAPTGGAVVAFLLQDRTFPRSVRHCFERAEESLGNIEVAAERRGPTPSLVAVRSIVDRLRSQNIVHVIQTGLHAELTHVVDTTASVGEQLHQDFFDPSTEFDLELASRAPGPRSSGQPPSTAGSSTTSTQSQSSSAVAGAPSPAGAQPAGTQSQTQSPPGSLRIRSSEA